MDTEALAKELHEAGREAVEKGATVAAEKFGEKTRVFLSWDEISETAKDGRRIQAAYLLERYAFSPLAKKEAMTDRFTECIEGVILPAMSDARLRLNKNGYSCTIEAPFEVHTDTQKKRYKTIHFRASIEEGADLSESRTAMLTPTLCVAPMTSGGKFDVRFLKVGSTPEYCEIMLDGMTDEIIAGQLSRFLARVY